MIVKSIDPKDKEIAELTALLKQAQTPDQKFLIERELRSMKTGIKGEEDCAYQPVDLFMINTALR